MLKTFQTKSYFIFIFLAFTLLSACGSSDKFSTTTIKDYKIYLGGITNPSLRSSMDYLVNRYNSETCVETIQVVDNEEDSNSTVEIIPGIKERDNKVGWGRWRREVYREEPVKYSGEKGSVTYVYSFAVQFDQGYMAERADLGTNEKRDDLFKLFAHEVGHGLEFNHTPSQSDVMYEDVSGNKDFSGYFKKVRDYLRDQPHLSDALSSSACQR